MHFHFHFLTYSYPEHDNEIPKKNIIEVGTLSESGKLIVSFIDLYKVEEYKTIFIKFT